MNVAFIKKCVEKAEGLECQIDKDGYVWVITPGGQKVSARWLISRSKETVYLLLQRAIEGVNMKGSIGLGIKYCIKGDRVYFMPIATAAYLGDKMYVDIDAAKEAALEWVFAQEEK